MARLPFPESEPDAPSASPAQAARPLTVTQANDLVRTVIGRLPSPIRIVGEISNLSVRTHWFFNLKDENASLRCVCFVSNARRMRFDVEEGMEVVATGRLDYWTTAGNVQLYVDSLDPIGQGPLELRLRQLCEALRQAGYFDPARKKPLPLLPRRVAVVTSRSGAALQDVIDTASRRWAGCQLLLVDVKVQGEQAAPQIAAAIDALSGQGGRLGIDAIILTRGGGSMEDLWAFNERIVADALFRCTLPVVAAIGHETDTTLAELVADVRCATPTQAAMTLIPDRQALWHQLDQFGHRLTLLLRRSLAESRHRLDAAARHPLFRQPRLMLQPHHEKLSQLQRALEANLPRRLGRQREQLNALARQLEALGPHNVLQRGYSYTLGPDGKVLRAADAVRPGDRLTTVLAEGRVQSTVDGQRPKPTRPAIRKRKDDDTPRLFG